MNDKLNEFIRRSKYRNPHLYLESAIEGEDYVICPISLAKMVMIKSSYIERILGMTVDNYDALYPNIQKIASKRIDKIKNGLKKIDPITGLTKHENSSIRAKQTLSMIGVDGLTGYARKGIKTKHTHMSTIDEFGRNGYSKLATKAILKGNNTKIKKGLIIPPTHRNFLSRYRTLVLYITSKHRSKLIAGYKTGLAGTKDAWHIDHKYSIQMGFKENISPLLIGDINNLEMIPWRENISKNSKCSITKEELFSLTAYTNEQSQLEFEIAMKLIYEDDSNRITPNGAYLLERINETILRN